MGLSKKAKTIDTLDAIVGVTSAFCMWSGSETLYTTAVALNLIELSVVKLPFVLSYVQQTQDCKALLYWAPKEVLANTSPLGSLLDIVPAYYMRTEYTRLKR
jgi:hypothetical protein